MFIFFFQAEDGIRDKLVTGVQTCALPIYDTIAGGEGFDVLRAGRGRDTLSGGPGNDRLIAAARIDSATDTVGGDEGDDRVLVRDGHRDVVTCGPGFDRVQADSADSIAADCEVVRVKTR